MTDPENLGSAHTKIVQHRAGIIEFRNDPLTLPRQQFASRAKQRHGPADEPLQRGDRPRGHDIDRGLAGHILRPCPADTDTFESEQIHAFFEKDRSAEKRFEQSDGQIRPHECQDDAGQPSAGAEIDHLGTDRDHLRRHRAVQEMPLPQPGHLAGTDEAPLHADITQKLGIALHGRQCVTEEIARAPRRGRRRHQNFRGIVETLTVIECFHIAAAAGTLTHKPVDIPHPASQLASAAGSAWRPNGRRPRCTCGSWCDCLPPVILMTCAPPNGLPGAVPSVPVARHLAADLARGGRAVRVLVPPGEIGGWPDEVEVVEGSVAEPEATPSAFAGLDGLLLAGLTAAVPTRLRALVNLILAGGVRRVVVLASHARDVETELSEETWQWLAFERALEGRGVPWTYVRPSGLFANALAGGYPITGAWWATRIRDGEPLREFRPHVPVPFIDEADVAAVISRVLMTGGYDGQVLDISGAVTTAAARARQLSEVIGRPVQLVELETADDARERWREQGWPDITIETTLWIAARYAADLDRNLTAVAGQQGTAQRILGRPTRTFADWLATHSASFAPQPDQVGDDDVQSPQ